MKKTAFILLALITIRATFSYGQTLHSIIFANTQERKIGTSVEVDFKRMELEMTTIAKSIGYTIKKYYYYGTPEKFSRNSLEEVITNLSCTPDDIIFFYYSGHGGRFENEKTDFPEMCLYVNEEDQTSYSQIYPLHDVYSRLKNKSPRLTIVMGDLCNSLWEGHYRRENNASKSTTLLSKGTCNVYKNLFLSVKGGLLAASSEPNYPSRCYNFYADGNLYTAGGYFTHSFLSVLQDFVGRSQDVSWESLLNNTIALTQNLTAGQTDGYGNSIRPQIPIYKSELSKLEATGNETALHTPPQMPTTSHDEATNTRDKLAYDLSMVCNQSVPRLDRIRNIPQAKRYFSDIQSYVQVVGVDNSTIVNTCSVESYLNYLSIATDMDQVVVLDTKEDTSGKISYIKVHEIHYQ